MTFGTFSGLKYLLFAGFRLPVRSLRRQTGSRELANNRYFNQRTSQKPLCIILVSPPTFLNEKVDGQ